MIGFATYAKYGNYLKTNTVSITRNNILHKAVTFRRMMAARGDPFGSEAVTPETLAKVILYMIWSRKFSPASEWILPRVGDGLNEDRAFAAFRMCCDPSRTTLQDVNVVFFTAA